jgi:ATP-binding cassette, subfamily B, bacterial
MQGHQPPAQHVQPTLGKIGRKEIPVVLQATQADSGACCLVMVLSFLGKDLRVEDIRQTMAVERDGGSAEALLSAASLHDLRGRSVRVGFDELAQLEPGAILNWGFKHFVVFEKMVGSKVRVVDPSFGRRDVTQEDASRNFTGIALVFEKTERFSPLRGKGKPVWKHVKAALTGSNLWGRIVMTSLLLQFFALGLPLINGRLVDRVVPRNDYHLLWVLLAGLCGTLVAHFFTSMVRNYLLLNLRTEFDVKMTVGFLDHLLRLPFWFFKKRQPADLILRVNSTHMIQDVVTSTVLSSVIDGILVVSYLAVLALISLQMAGLAVGIVFLQSCVFLITRKTIYELSFGSLSKHVQASDYLNEILTGIESLKVTGAEARAMQQWTSMYVDLMNINLRRAGVAAWSESLNGTINILSPFVILIVGILQVMKGDLTLGVMLSAHSFAIGFIHPTANLIHSLTQLQMIGGSVARLEDVLSTEVEQKNAQNLRVAPPLQGNVEMKNVSYTYVQRTPLVIKNVSLKILRGQYVAIVGRSGAGKSTLASLIVGMHVPVQGEVHYDGMRLMDFDLRSVRRQLGVVVQKPYIFGATVRANIALNEPTMPLERIQRAAKMACVHDDIMKMPLGYDTAIAPGGTSLSNGHRQRIALARALVNSPAMLVLDEATSALDAATEREVQAQLDQLGCTRVIIAHRLSTVVRADQILVMDNGMIVETGTHDQLIKKGGVYARLVMAQLGAADGQVLTGLLGAGGSRPPAHAPATAPPPDLNAGYDGSTDSWRTVAAASPLQNQEYQRPGGKTQPPPAPSIPPPPDSWRTVNLPSPRGQRDESVPEPTIVLHLDKLTNKPR